MLPRFEPAGRLRPVDLVAPGAVLVDDHSPESGAEHATPHPAPYAAAVAELAPSSPTSPSTSATLTLTSGSVRLTATYDDRGVSLSVTGPGSTHSPTTRAPTTHRSRRDGRPPGPVDALGLTLTGTHLCALTRADGVWTARGRVDLALLDDPVDTRDEAWLTALRTGLQATPGAVTRLLAGGFGQLGLRDVRLVTYSSGAAYVPEGGGVLLTATSAGPGFFDTAHTSVWALDPDALTLAHRADLFFRRPDRPGSFGDHATHLVRHDDRWLVATSTWGDFEARRPGEVRTVGVTLAETTADVTTGRHLLDTRALVLPTHGFTSVGVWDPHLVHTGQEWLVGFVSARKFFRFHPALASGPDLDTLRLRGAATDRRATEGTTLIQLDGTWRVLASDGPDGRRSQREAYPVFDLDLTTVGELDAPYPTNIPWPTLVRSGDGWLMVGFDGRRYGGRLVGYGSHGDVVFARSVGA